MLIPNSNFALLPPFLFGNHKVAFWPVSNNDYCLNTCYVLTFSMYYLLPRYPFYKGEIEAGAASQDLEASRWQGQRRAP